MNPNNPKASPPEPPSAPPVAPDNFQTLLHAGAALNALHGIDASEEKLPAVVIPKGYELQTLDRDECDLWAGHPRRKTGTFVFGDVDSFIRYFNEHKSADARVFAKISDTGAKFYGIVNFHGASPSFNDHRCAVQLTPTMEWTTWLNYARKQMTQAVFAGFLEDNADWFVKPSGLDLLELVSSLEGKSHVDITQAVKLQTGAISLKYSEVVELKGGTTSNQSGELTVPKELVVGIACFEGTSRRDMRARLRYRIDNRKIIFWYEPIDAHLHVRALCNGLLNIIQSQTGLEPFLVAASGLNADNNNND